MENKSNESTPLRPQGERVIQANLVEIDLNKYIEQIKGEKLWQEKDVNSITLFKSDDMRIVLIGLHDKAEIKTHTTHATISVQVIKGKIKFITSERSCDLATQQMITLQPDIPHRVEAEEESFFLLTTVPVQGKVSDKF